MQALLSRPLRVGDRVRLADDTDAKLPAGTITHVWTDYRRNTCYAVAWDDPQLATTVYYAHDLQALPPALLTLAEAMAYLRVSRSTLHRLLASGQLRGHKVGSTWRFYPRDLDAAIRDASVTSPNATRGE